jgi:hypothetical protein
MPFRGESYQAEEKWRRMLKAKKIVFEGEYSLQGG